MALHDRDTVRDQLEDCVFADRDLTRQLTRDLEIDPKKYYPPDVYREPLTTLADPQEVDLLEMAKVMGFDLSKLIK